MIRAVLIDGAGVCIDSAAVLAEVPPLGSVVVFGELYFHVNGIEYLTTGIVKVRVTERTAPVWSGHAIGADGWIGEPVIKRLTIEQMAQQAPGLSGCSKCGGMFVDKPGARQEHSRVCRGKQIGPPTVENYRALSEVLGRLADLREAASCTGVAAVWCPRCGDCRCKFTDEGERIEEGEETWSCPLHGRNSNHAAGSP